MGRGGDMDDVDVGTLEDLPEVLVAFDAGAADLERFLEVAGVHITDSEEPRAFVIEMGFAHAADADDGFGQFVRRRHIALAAEDEARDDSETGRGGDGGLDEVAAGDRRSLGHA
jgi:hypothetical protein